MFTGRRAFEGDDVTETLAAVVRGEPPWDVLPNTLSPTCVMFLRRCLFKDAKQRLADIRDMRLALEGAFETQLSGSTRRRAPDAGAHAPYALTALTAALASAIIA
jgi:hypothetical protein